MPIISLLPWTAFVERRNKMTTVKIKGMSCQHCVMAVTKALKEIEGLQDVAVDLEKGEAAFTETKPVDKNMIKDKVKKAGYEVVG
jgi:copper chaperone